MLKYRSLVISSTSSDVFNENNRYELYSHADTSVVGRNCLVAHVYQGRYFNVSGFDPALETVKDLEIMNAALAYYCPMTGQVIIIKINQVSHIKTMVTNVLFPMQFRMTNISVFDCPKFLIENTSAKMHRMFISCKNDDKIVIPLTLHGVVSYFPTRKSTLREVEEAEMLESNRDLTYETPDWEPRS